MPEGHTIHRLARDLRKELGTGPIRATSPQGRFTEGAAALDGRSMHRSEAWGKHLFADFGTDVLHVHLGLIGKFRPAPLGERPRDTIRLRLENDVAAWDLTGPQSCRLVGRDELVAVTDSLGPDPLRRGARGDTVIAAAAKRTAPIAAVLLDQSVIAGIGNVYRAEFLFLEGIDPRTPAKALDASQIDSLWELSKDQLRQGVRLNRIVTVTREDAGAPAGRLSREDSLYVYKREGLPCRRCGAEIAIGDVGGRSCWWCPRCQR